MRIAIDIDLYKYLHNEPRSCITECCNKKAN